MKLFSSTLHGLHRCAPARILTISLLGLSLYPPAGAFAAQSAQDSHPATTIQWKTVGPVYGAGGGSGKVEAFAYVQSNPKIMYMAAGWGNTPRESPSQSGIYKSNDGGKTWTPANQGLTNLDGTISSVVNGLWLDQKNPSVVLAATEMGGIFKSSDAGASWTNVGRSEATEFAQNGATLYASTRKGVLASSDDGGTWTVSLPIAVGATTVVSVKGSVWAADAQGYAYKLNGSAWTKLGHAGTGAIHELAVDPFNGKTIYASVDDKIVWNQALYVSSDGGSTWAAVNTQGVWAQAFAFSTVTPHRMFFAGDGGGLVYFSGTGGTNPVFHNAANVAGVDFRRLILAPGASKKDDACYIGMDQGLFYASTCSSGQTVDLSDNVANTLIYDVAVSADRKAIFAAVQDSGSVSSSDGGKTWTGGFVLGEGGEARIHPDNSGYCYATHPDDRLYVSTNFCSTFDSGDTTEGFESLTFDPSNSRHLYGVLGETSGNPRVVQSNDKGKTWSNTAWSITKPYQVAVAPSNAKSIVVVTGSSPTSTNTVNYTTDGGSTWHLSSGLPTTAPASPIFFPVHRFYAAFDPHNASIVLVADHDPATNNVLLYKSTDGGAHFTLAQTFVQPKTQRPWPISNTSGTPPKSAKEDESTGYYYAIRFYGNRLAFNLESGSNTPDVALTTRFGAFVSTDDGSTWTQVDTAAVPHDFIGATWSQGYLYLASFGQGIIQSAAPLQ